MDFFELANKRRSVRKFTDDPIPEEVMRKTLDAKIKQFIKNLRHQKNLKFKIKGN